MVCRDAKPAECAGQIREVLLKIHFCSGDVSRSGVRCLNYLKSRSLIDPGLGWKADSASKERRSYLHAPLSAPDFLSSLWKGKGAAESRRSRKECRVGRDNPLPYTSKSEMPLDALAY